MHQMVPVARGPSRSAIKRCAFYATAFCISDSCPTHPQCVLDPTWKKATACITTHGGPKYVCPEEGCPCWSGRFVEDVTLAYCRFMSRRFKLPNAFVLSAEEVTLYLLAREKLRAWKWFGADSLPDVDIDRIVELERRIE